jgi:hypothetical protein
MGPPLTRAYVKNLTHTYQMHDRLTVTNRQRFGCDSQARTPNRKPGLRLITTRSLRQNSYLNSLGINGGEVDGTAVMEGGKAAVVCPIYSVKQGI